MSKDIKFKVKGWTIWIAIEGWIWAFGYQDFFGAHTLYTPLFTLIVCRTDILNGTKDDTNN